MDRSVTLMVDDIWSHVIVLDDVFEFQDSDPFISGLVATILGLHLKVWSII